MQLIILDLCFCLLNQVNVCNRILSMLFPSQFPIMYKVIEKEIKHKNIFFQ